MTSITTCLRARSLRNLSIAATLPDFSSCPVPRVPQATTYSRTFQNCSEATNF
jgi:hypothetical protein